MWLFRARSHWFIINSSWKAKNIETNLPRVYREVGCHWFIINSSGAISSRCSSNGSIVNCTSAAGNMIPLHFSKLPSAYCSQHWTTTSSIAKPYWEKHIKTRRKSKQQKATDLKKLKNKRPQAWHVEHNGNGGGDKNLNMILYNDAMNSHRSIS